MKPRKTSLQLVLSTLLFAAFAGPAHADLQLAPAPGREISAFTSAWSGTDTYSSSNQSATAFGEGGFNQSYTQAASLTYAQFNNTVSQVSSITTSGNGLVVSGTLALTTSLITECDPNGAIGAGIGNLPLSSSLSLWFNITEPYSFTFTAATTSGQPKLPNFYQPQVALWLGTTYASFGCPDCPDSGTRSGILPAGGYILGASVGDNSSVRACGPNYANAMSASFSLIVKPVLTYVGVTNSLTLSDLPGTQTAGLEVVAATASSSLTFEITNKTDIVAPVRLTADDTSSVSMVIGTNGILNIPWLELGPNSSLELPGILNGDLANNSPDTNCGMCQIASFLLAQNQSMMLAYDKDLNGLGVLDSTGSSTNTGGAASLGASRRGRSPKGPGIPPPPPAGPTFTGLMTVNGNYSQFAGGALLIAIAGTNTASTGAQQYDQLVVRDQANLAGGRIDFGLFNPDNQTNQAGVFQPVAGDTFDVVVASNIVTHALTVRGRIWGDGLHFNWSVVTRPDGRQALRLVATHVPPRLFLQTAGSQLQLVYPTNYTGYTVQSAPTLSSPSWTPFSTGTNLVVLSPTNSSGFFRLSKP